MRSNQRERETDLLKAKFAIHNSAWLRWYFMGGTSVDATWSRDWTINLRTNCYYVSEVVPPSSLHSGKAAPGECLQCNFHIFIRTTKGAQTALVNIHAWIVCGYKLILELKVLSRFAIYAAALPRLEQVPCGSVFPLIEPYYSILEGVRVEFFVTFNYTKMAFIWLITWICMLMNASDVTTTDKVHVRVIKYAMQHTLDKLKPLCKHRFITGESQQGNFSRQLASQAFKFG